MRGNISATPDLNKIRVLFASATDSMPCLQTYMWSGGLASILPYDPPYISSEYRNIIASHPHPKCHTIHVPLLY